MRRLHGLDALRGIAAFSVVLHHVMSLYSLTAGYVIIPETAVDLFFILSGFVMTRTYEARLRDGMTTPQFMAIRYKRLFLPLAVGSTLGLAWALMQIRPSLSIIAEYLLILLFLPAPWLYKCFVLNGPAWSLFEEVASNALHGAIIAKRSTRAVLAIWLATTGLFIGLFVFRTPGWGPDFGQIALLFPREFSCYLMGVLIFRTYGDAPLGNKPMLAIAAVSAILFAGQLPPAIDLAATFIAAPLLVRASLGLRESSWAMWFGAFSYPLYATHFPIIRLSVLAKLPPLASVIIALFVAAALAVLFEARRRRAVSWTVSQQSSAPTTFPVTQ